MGHNSGERAQGGRRNTAWTRFQCGLGGSGPRPRNNGPSREEEVPLLQLPPLLLSLLVLLLLVVLVLVVVVVLLLLLLLLLLPLLRHTVTQ